MVEWVLKGSLKGPQGEPGQDAQLPAGGTDGQVLTKTSGGEAWADVPQPDMTGVVKTGTIQVVPGVTALSVGGAVIEALAVGTESAASAVGDGGFISMDQSGSATITTQAMSISSSGNMFYVSLDDGMVLLSHGQNSAGIIATDSGAGFTIDSKTVTSITDDASTGDTNALATAKAVKDYVDAHGMPPVVPINRGGTGATTADGAAMMVFAHAPEASPTQAGVVKTLSDEDFCAYMGMEYDPADWS